LSHSWLFGIVTSRGSREWKRETGGIERMNKTELIQKVADKADGSKNEAQRFFDAFQDVVTSALKNDDQVQITGFGKFYVQKRDAREGINPQTKQKMTIAASRVPKFTAGNSLKDAIK
jgi:DNA-binding protein HU-beta